MLLINTSSLKLEEFFEEKIPKYAILSHTWAEGEISYKDFVKNRNHDAAGWTKIRNCCKFAHNRGHNYVWIDTCCIDKRSSAELSEAINSMYRWYQQTKVCYAYLSDVSYDEGFEHEGENGSANEVDVKNNDNIEDEIEDVDKTNPDDDLEDSNDEMLYTNGEKPHHLPEHVERAFCASKWFTRGWTLQELLAPNHVYFIDRSWRKVLGDKKALSALIVKITGIDRGVLTEHFRLGFSTLHRYSVAMRMSWASSRVCTRGEDVAYSLMGIFKVNMPLLYGEGKSVAFRRLQLEIINSSNDESIFAWLPSREDLGSRWLEFDGMLAKSPRDFRFSANIEPFDSGLWTVRQPYYQTNRGLAFQTVLRGLLSPEMKQMMLGPVGSDLDRTFLLPLQCRDVTQRRMEPVAIIVESTGPREYNRVVFRTEAQKLEICPDEMFADIKHTEFVGKEELIFLEV